MGVHKVFLHAYRMMDRLVTNQEYMEFMNDGGYQRAAAMAGRRMGLGKAEYYFCTYVLVL